MKYYKYIFALILLLSCGFSQVNSIITIKGTGTSSTSAHITLPTNTYLCPNEYIVQNGATLTIWDASAICGCTNGSIIYNTETGKFNFCENGIWVEKWLLNVDT